jgi:hypothetical protein
MTDRQQITRETACKCLHLLQDWTTMSRHQNDYLDDRQGEKRSFEENRRYRRV